MPDRQWLTALGTLHSAATWRSPDIRRCLDLAFGRSRCYRVTMSAEKLRRPFTKLLALALSLGLVAHSMPGGTSIAQAAEMTDSISADMAMDVPMDMPMSGDCNGCAGDEKALMSAGCHVFCVSAVASALPFVLFETAPLATLMPAEGIFGAGYVGPPDPYPPRSIVLS